MATLVLSYDTGAVPLSEVVDAVSGALGYEATVGTDAGGNPIPNPETKAVYAHRLIGKHLMELYNSHKYNVRMKASQGADAGVILT